MKTTFKTILAAALLFGVAALGVNGHAQARQFGYIIGAATVDGVTTTACTTGRNQTVSGFGNGVSMDQVWALEVESGSPGSGAWATVIGGYSDVFPTANSGAAVGGVTQIIRYTSAVPACFRLHMTSDSGGTAQIQLVTDGDTKSTSMTTSSHVRRFDDFLTGVIPITTGDATVYGSYEVYMGGGSNAVIWVVEGDQEGVITGTSGATDNDTDQSVMSYGLLAHGSLISSGLTVFEVRLTQATSALITRMQFGLGDIIQTGSEEQMFECNTNVCAQLPDDDFDDAVAFLYDTDSNDAEGDFWLAVSENADTMGNAADEYSLGNTPVVDTYQVLTLEVDASGHAFYYINNLLMGAEPLSVATTAVLVPTLQLNSPDDGSAAIRKAYVDYLDFYVPRPSVRP